MDWHESPLDYVLDCANQCWRILDSFRAGRVQSRDAIFVEDVELLRAAIKQASGVTRAQFDSIANPNYSCELLGARGESWHMAVLNLSQKIIETIDQEGIFAAIGAGSDQGTPWAQIRERINGRFPEFGQEELERVRAELFREQAIARNKKEQTVGGAHAGTDTRATQRQHANPLPETRRRILELLDGKAMIGKLLAKNLKRTEERLNQDHLSPMVKEGIIKNRRSVGGYYRPDAPPRS